MISGRALGIVPRNNSTNGYVDLEIDDFEEGRLLHELQGISEKMNHRSMPAKEQ